MVSLDEGQAHDLVAVVSHGFFAALKDFRPTVFESVILLTPSPLIMNAG